MARAPDPRIEQAKAMYRAGKKLVEIANQLNLPEGTVRRWKSTYRWGCERSDKNSERSKYNANVRKENKKVVAEEVKQVMENPDLTDKQRLFCLYYVKYRNQVKAYQKAYECSYEVACGHASPLWKKVEIQKEINRIIDEIREDIKIDIVDLIQQQIDIARADINDYVNIESGSVVAKKDIDGTLVKEIKETANGISIKLYDKQSAIEWLRENISAVSDEDDPTIAGFLRAMAPTKNDIDTLFIDKDAEEDGENDAEEAEETSKL